MSDPFLILHKVRGEPAFDIAIQIACPLCHQGEYPMCVECDETGFWWIIPTSGHRAHPAAAMRLATTIHNGTIWVGIGHAATDFGTIPDGWPDHYPSRSAPSIDIRSVITALAPQGPVDRRD